MYSVCIYIVKRYLILSMMSVVSMSVMYFQKSLDVVILDFLNLFKGLGLFGHFMLDISSLKYLHDM